MTAGEYLKNLLSEKNITPTNLCALTGIKSRNTIYRLFNGYHSSEKTRSLIQRITAVIDFSDKEKAKLDELLSGKKVNPFFVEARRILSVIYNNSADTYKTPELLNPAKVNIYICDMDDPDVFNEIRCALTSNKDAVIYHYVHLFKHRILTAQEIAMIIMLSRYKNYMPIITEGKLVSGAYAITERSGKYMLYEKEKVGNEYMNFKTNISPELYGFIEEKHKRYRTLSRSVKEPVKKVIDYIDLISESLVFDKGLTFYSEGSPCFGYIPYEIIYDMFKDINYLGFPPDHPYVLQLMELFKSRFDMFMDDPDAKKYFLFDTEHIKHMMQTGITFDHAEEFNPLSPKQLRQYFDWLIEISQKKDGKVKCRFLKDGIIKNPYVYGQDNMLYMFYSETGYMDGFTIKLREKGIFEIMNDFTSYVWDEFTMSDEESLELLRNMADEYITS